MHRKPLLALTIFAPLLFSSLATAQVTQRPNRQEGVTREVAVRAAEATPAKRLDKKSREYAQMVADKTFLDACEVVLADGERVVSDSGQISQAGSAFTITLNVTDDATGATGEYRQLVYSFDGKDAKVFFNEKNERYTKQKTAVGSGVKKIKFPPDWWPGSGGGSTGLGGGSSWSDWHQVSIDNCHANFFCPFIHMGKMRQEERVSNLNSSIKQTRWILLSCGCN